MTKPSTDPMLDHLAALAREQEPPPLDDDEAAVLVRRAMHRAEVSSSREPRRPWLPLALAAALIPLVIVSALIWFSHRDGAANEPLRATLPTGDRLIAVPGARFEVDSAEAEHRQVSLSSGAVLFDVAALAGEQRFEVVTRDARVVVHGTVFSVDARGEDTVVRVYEGRVEVVRGEERQLLEARRMWGSRSRAVLELDSDGPLCAEGQEAARRRTVTARADSSSNDGEPGDEVTAAAPEPSSSSELTEAQAIASSEVAPAETASETLGAAIDEGRRLPAAGRAPASSLSAVPATPAIRARPHRPCPVEATGARASSANGQPLRDEEATDEVSEEEEAIERPSEPPAELPPTPTSVRRLLLEGRAEEALGIARQEQGGAWRMVEADALRALRRYDEAVAAYERAAGQLSGGMAAQAGYLAASTRFRQGDARGALSTLDGSSAMAPGSPLAERATALRVRLLHRLGRRAEARREAEGYLRDYPNGGMASWMRSLLAD